MIQLTDEGRAPMATGRVADTGPDTLVLECEVPGAEIVHFADPTMMITSRHNRVSVTAGDAVHEIVLPEAPYRRALGQFRVARRALRLDKCNVTPTGADRSGLVIVRNRQAFHYDFEHSRLTPTLKMRHCRNVLHGAVTVLDHDNVVFGEYGPSGSVVPVPIYRSTDGGRGWKVVYEFSPGSVRHVHGCYWDPVEEQYWIFTGDADDEVCVMAANRDFSRVTRIGGGSQRWRACSAFFTEKYVYWGMDSEREDSHLVRFDRESRTIEIGQLFPGPVWYTKRTSDGLYLAQSSCESGAGVHDEYGHLFVSRDLERWQEVGRFPWDGLPKGWFKLGVIGFAEGEQSSDRFYIFGEALRGIEGRSFECRLACA